jgi:hypothetical protein
VIKIANDDTIDVQLDGPPIRVRYIGINMLETKHLRKEPKPFGQEAKAANRQLVEGQTVRLERDVQPWDCYHRWSCSGKPARPSGACGDRGHDRDRRVDLCKIAGGHPWWHGWKYGSGSRAPWGFSNSLRPMPAVRRTSAITRCGIRSWPNNSSPASR